MCALAVCMLLCVAVIVISSMMSSVCFRGVGISEVYMLKSVGKGTPPCGTSVLH